MTQKTYLCISTARCDKQKKSRPAITLWCGIWVHMCHDEGKTRMQGEAVSQRKGPRNKPIKPVRKGQVVQAVKNVCKYVKLLHTFRKVQRYPLS